MEIKPETPVVYPSRRKVADLTPEEAETRRRRTRASVRKSRRKQKTEKVLLEAAVEQTERIEDFSDESKISQYVTTVEKKIAAELPELTPTLSELEDEVTGETVANIIFYVASACAGLDGFGVFVDKLGLKLGGVYADAAAAQVIKFLRTNPLLLKSATFTQLYRAMLIGVYERYRYSPNVDARDLQIIRAELRGKE